MYGRDAMVDMLLNKGGAVDQRDEKGATALHLASLVGSARTVRILLARGANVHAVDNDGQTAVTYALGHVYRIDINKPNRPCVNIVHILLSHGAEVDTSNQALWEIVKG